MIISEFLQEISIKGWKLWSENGRLRYRAPNNEATPSVLEQLTLYKVEILKLLQEQPNILEVYPLSYGQRALWLLWQLAPESSAYNVAFNCRIRSDVDVAALQKVFQLLIERHPILRSTFPKLGTEPIQRVNPKQAVDFQQIDASNSSEEELKTKVIAAYQSPFDLERKPVMRVRLFTCSKQEHILLLIVHHIIGEGWSIGILLDELKVLYPELRTGREATLPPPVHSHQDYVRWQRTIIESAEGECLWNYWQQQLAGELPVLNLPVNKPRPSVQSYNGASYPLYLSEPLTQQLKELAQSEASTLYTILLAAFKVLLHRYTDQDDILVGSPTASRHRPEFTQIVGYLVNPVVLRTDLSGNPSFREFLAQVRNTVLAAIEHQDYPFSLIVERLQPRRDASRSPIFQAAFVLQKLQQTPDVLKLYSSKVGTSLDWGGLVLEPFEMPQQEGQFDLTLEIAETSSFLVGDLKYNTDLFNKETIARMAGHFQTLLEAIVNYPELPISQLPLLSEQQRYQLLVEWNQIAADYFPHRCVHQLFEEQVQRTPNAVAVVYENQQLTYQQLNERANQLAHYLLSLGVKPEVLVGLCVERSLEMIVGILGILKAGGAYVPLDPTYPTERLAYMLADAQVSVLLTQEKLKAVLPKSIATIVFLDTCSSLVRQSTENPLSVVKPDNLIYIIYTSGSTGEPKGVLITHSNVVRLFQATQDWYHFNNRDVWTLFHSYAFDFSVWELWGALIYGGRLVVVPYDISRSSLDFYKLLCSEKVTVLNQTPSAFRQLMEADEFLGSACELSLRFVIFGGEAFDIHSLKPWFQRHGDRTPVLVNMYGITETTVHVTFRQLTIADLDSNASTIGRTIPDLEVYILDRYQNPVPIGVAGEMYVGGAGLARGYLNRTKLTAQRFISHPFSADKQAKLYKTGDLARYLPSGDIEYLGRIDYQVKVRGFRIELGEIEAVLASHQKVRQAVVIAKEDQPGNKRLVAYIVPNFEPLTTNELRTFLKQQLPEYMIPGAFVLLEAMPLTPNGKLDRLALLLEPDIVRSGEFVPPQTLTQELIANIFTAVLGVPVGIYDNFFELGGHSLLATQIVSRLRQAFEIEVPLRSLFEFPTVAELERILCELRQVEPLKGQKPDVSLPPLVPDLDQRYQPFPLTDIQQAYWLGRDSTFDLGNIASHVYFEIDCHNLNLEHLNQAWQKLVDRHDMMRLVVLPNGQQQVQKLVPPYQFQVLDLRQELPQTAATQLEAIRRQMSHQVKPADQWPLFEIRASILDKKRIRLHLSIDVLIADAFSLNLIGQQWLQLYHNPDSLLPKIELSFRDYVLATLAFKDTPQYQRSQKYWLNRLNTLPPAPELPLTRNLASTQEPQFGRHHAQLDPEHWQQLKNKAVRANLTPSSVLLATFVDVLTFWSKSPKFTINLTLFNRLPLHPQVNDLVGDFTSLNLLEVDNSVAVPFTNRAQRLQQQLWQDLDHQYFSGVEVQRELRRQRGSYQPMGVVFTSILGLNSLAQEEFSLNQLGEMVYGISQTPQVWLDQQVYEQDGALVFNWDAVEDLFPVGVLDDMFETYCNWLKNLATSDIAWDELHPQLLPLAQLEQRSAVNNTATIVSEKTLHGLFIEQVKFQAQAIAIITPERTLTYQELYLRANQLGHQLRQLGAAPNTLVAVVMEKGWEQVVAVLGILISGAAYLPIDVELPKERKLYLLEQGEVKLVLTQSRLQEQLPLPKGVQCLLVDTEEGVELDLSCLESVQSTTDLAYVIYTSGSTGVPKGVMIDHQGAVNTILDINQRFGVGTGDRVLALSALNFDLSVYDIFGLLAAGGCLVIPSSEKIKDPSHWLELMTSHQVTLWNTVPALMQMLLEYLTGNQDKVTLSLQLALLSGDWIPLSLPKQVKAIGSDVQVVSLGGATEASIWSIYYPIEEVDPSWKSIPYGKPLLNQRFYVFNELMQPCPLWVSGQLYIGGIGLAQGYWKNQLKTQASFITHPITQERLYKTGDLGRYLPDDNIEFLGREDFQVKINGYRVELGEIEAVLRLHPTVKEAIVTVVGELKETKRLVAYVVQKATSNLQPAQSEAYDPHQLQGVIVDPLERIEFKLGQPGLRQLQSAQTTIELPKPEFDEALTQAYLARQSYREFLPKSISLEEFSQFFSCLLPMQLENYPLPKYRYPSAGNLYPVQTYIFIKPNAVNGLEAGIYYYHPLEHRLVLLSSITEIDDSVYGGNQSIFEQSAFSVFLIGQLSAISPMYGELAMNFCLLEAGHMGQLLMSNAPIYSIGLCPIGNLEFSKLRELFKLESSHILLYSFAGGKIDSSQTKRWFSSNAGQKANSISDDLREYLRQKLPEYMIPKSLMQLEALPLTPNGKVNYKALPQPELAEFQQEKTFVAPRTSVEEQLAQMVENILNLDRVGIYDNFFEVGGDSLLATRLISKIRETFVIELPLRQFFENPTVSNIADYIETVNWVGQEVEVAKIELEEEEI